MRIRRAVSSTPWWQLTTRRQMPFLTDADRRVLSAYAQKRDSRILTRYYFEWEPIPQQLKLLNGGLGYPSRTDAYHERHAVAGARSGKTEGFAMDHLLGGMLIPGDEAVTLNCSITQDQANIGFGIAEMFALNSPRFRHWILDIVHSPFPEITLANGHRITSRSTQDECKRIRGHKFVRACYDEAAYGNEGDVLVLQERLADYNGQLSFGTTPRGKNWYYRDHWQRAELHRKEAKLRGTRPDKLALSWSSLDNPHVNPDYWHRLELTDRQRQQEIEGRFLEAENQPWTPDQVEAIVNADLEDTFKSYCPEHFASTNPELAREINAGKVKLPGAKSGEQWLTVWDLAKESDWMVGLAGRIDTKPYRVLYFTRFNKVPWPIAEGRMDKLALRFGAKCGFDATGIGNVTKDHLDIPFSRLLPFVFTRKSKTELMVNLQRCIHHKKVEIPFIRQMVNELYDYEWDDTGLVKDCVMALAMFCWFAEGKPARAAGAV